MMLDTGTYHLRIGRGEGFLGKWAPGQGVTGLGTLIAAGSSLAGRCAQGAEECGAAQAAFTGPDRGHRDRAISQHRVGS